MSSDDDSVYIKFLTNVFNTVVDRPASIARDVVTKIKDRNPTVPYYHRRFKRVPTIDECYTDDVMCKFEADQQYKRDKIVDDHVLNILRNRYRKCQRLEPTNRAEKCMPLKERYEHAAGEWFAKYGDLVFFQGSWNAYMKQKHRMVFERRQREKAEQGELVDD